MADPNSDVALADGALDWSGGVDSLKVTTIASSKNPHGLARNELAWLINGTVRDGGISPRGGWRFNTDVTDGTALFQGAAMYQPPFGDPYIIASIGGHIYQIVPGRTPVDLSLTAFVTTAPPNPWVYLLNIDAGPVGATVSGNVPGLGTVTAFTIPPAGQYVKVYVSSAYGGAVGDVISVGGVGGISNWSLKTLSGTTYPETQWGPVNPFQMPGTPDTYLSVKTHQQSYSDPSSTYPAIWGVSYYIEGFATPGHMQVSSFGPVLSNQALNPPNIAQAYFCQAEQFMVIQAGDGVTLPLFWDGTTLRRSKGINNTAISPGTPGVNEIPAAYAMDYYMGRLWYAQGRAINAGDIVYGASGTAAYNFVDAVLNVTENPLVVGGDGFLVPSNEGNITALRHNANIDAALGQGRLFAFTAKAVYQLNVPVTRTAWIAATNDNQPTMVVAQLSNGAAGDRGIVAVNGDLFYPSLEPGIRTMVSATRYFGQWGNVPISSKIDRLMQYCDKSLMNFCSGILFDNRVMFSVLPQASPQGIIHPALAILDFTPMSQFGNNLEPVWEGMYEGLDFLQLFTGIYNQQERALALVVSRTDKSIDLWELTTNEYFDNGSNRITYICEFPAFTFGDEFKLKKEIGAELWVDRVFGEVVFTLEYRPDGECSWTKWHEFKICNPSNSCNNTGTQPCTGLQQVICYPITQLGESYRATITIPKPPENCEKTMGRPTSVAYQFQPRLTVKGFARLRGFLLHGTNVERKLYANLSC